MAYTDSLARRIRQETTHCSTCHDIAPPDAAIDAHSITGLHLVQRDNDADYGVITVTDPPQSLLYLKDKKLDQRVNPLYQVQSHDGCGVCPECHDEIKRIALEHARQVNPSFRGNTPPPWILASVSLAMMERGRPMLYQVNLDLALLYALVV